MGNASFTVPAGTSGNSAEPQRHSPRHPQPQPQPPAQQGPPPPKFAELTGAYWLEPIFTGLAQEWSSQGRAVPGTPKDRWQNMADTRGAPGEPPEPGGTGADQPEQGGAGSRAGEDGGGGGDSGTKG